MALLGPDALELVGFAAPLEGPAAGGVSEWSERNGVQVQAGAFAERAVEEAVKHLKLLTDAFDLQRLHNPEVARWLMEQSPLRGWGAHLARPPLSHACFASSQTHRYEPSSLASQSATAQVS